MRLRSALFFVAVTVLGFGCIVEAPTGGSAQQGPGRAGVNPQQARAALAPPLQVKVGANLGDKIEVVGAVVEPGVLTPGLPARVSVFFKVMETMPQEWMIFVHVEDAEGKMERLNVDHKPVNGTYPTNQWKKGETVKDEFQVYLPPGAQSRAVNILMGLWDPNSDTRLKLMNPAQVKNDGRDRMLLVQVPVAQ